MTDTSTPDTHQPLLTAMVNLSSFHRDHEKFYSSAPRESAVMLQRHARTLQGLADTWSAAQPSTRDVLSPYEGAEDLNSPVATQLDGVLFLEGEGRPSEITRLIRDLRNVADDQRATASWLGQAMESSWGIAAVLIEIDGLADLIGERHRIIANDWQAAGMSSVMSHLLERAADIIEHVDLTPASLRADLGDRKVAVGLIYSAAELISHAADLSSESAGLVHDNERRWRVFHQRVSELAGQPRSSTAAPVSEPSARSVSARSASRNS